MTVTFRAASSAWENGATGLTADEVVTIPASSASGDMMLLLAAWKDFGITAQVAGWTELIEIADGSVGTGNGAGSMKVGCWYKEHTGSESNPTLDFSTTTGLVGEACMITFQRSLGAWSTPVFVSAAWPSSSSQTVNASSTVDVPSGGAIVCVLGVRDDGTFTSGVDAIEDSGSPNIAWNGATQKPTTDASTTTGNDMSSSLMYRLVTTGASAATLTHTNSLAAVETGMAIWVVLGDVTLQDRPPVSRLYPQILSH